MIMYRDLQAVEFLEEYKVASTSTLCEVFYPSLRVCQRRLKALHDGGYINHCQVDIRSEQIHYTKKPKFIKHPLLVTEFYRELHKAADIAHFKIEVSLGDIRPDAIFGYTIIGKNYIGLLEVELSHKGLDLDKYEKFYNSGDYKKYFPVMPSIFVVTDRQIKPTTLPLKQIYTNMANAVFTF